MLKFSETKTVPFNEIKERPSLVFPDLENDAAIDFRFLYKKPPNETETIVARLKSPTEILISPFWKPFRFVDLFAGIGGIRLGFEAVGGECVFSSEWDRLAQETYRANFGETPAGDVTQINAASVPDHEILTAGFPCQPFSVLGKRQGFGDTRGTLFFEIERILSVKKPTAVFLENVKQFRTHDEGRTCRTVLERLQHLGYQTHIAVLNALDYGVAQKRERTFIVGFLKPLRFRFPIPCDWRPSLDDVLESNDAVDPSLFASEKIQQKRLDQIARQGRTPFSPSIWHENKGGQIGIHPYSCALRHNASYNYLLVDGKRRLSSRETLRLQGFPESFRIVVKPSVVRAQAGNAVAVPVIAAIAAEMIASLKNDETEPEPDRQSLLFNLEND